MSYRFGFIPAARLGALALLFAGFAFASSSLHAQTMPMPGQTKPTGISWGSGWSKQPRPLRTIVGTVYGPDGNVMKDAMVFLKNTRTSDVLTLHVDDKGSFTFGPLSLSEDFQVWAESGKVKTAVKPVSSFLETTLVTVPLRFTSEPQDAVVHPAAQTK